jgi:ABC-type nitrate/sulfonate/bicarbonate transport system permease component
MNKENKINEKTKSALLMVASIIFGFLVWWQVINRLVEPVYWPALTSLLQAIKKMGATLPTQIWASVQRTILGYLLGCTLGVLIAYGMSWSKIINALITPYIEILRPVPAIALIPFFLLWFGIGNLGKILLIGMGAFVVMVITVLEGIHQLNPVYIRAATILGASKWGIYKSIIFPGSLPAIMGGLRVNAAFSFGMMIGAEFLGAQSGLGYLIIVSRRTFATEVMLLSVILIGILSFLFDRIVLITGRYITRWTPE